MLPRLLSYYILYQQFYLVIKAAWAGDVLHDWHFRDVKQVESVLLQVTLALAQAEQVTTAGRNCGNADIQSKEKLADNAARILVFRVRASRFAHGTAMRSGTLEFRQSNDCIAVRVRSPTTLSAISFPLQGNVLLQQIPKDKGAEMLVTLGGKSLKLKHRGLGVSLIDFTFSRIHLRMFAGQRYPGISLPLLRPFFRGSGTRVAASANLNLYMDLKLDGSPLGEEGACRLSWCDNVAAMSPKRLYFADETCKHMGWSDPRGMHFHTYARMQDLTEGDWSQKAPHTNILWLQCTP
jgi:hypothetical protein